MKNPRNLYLFYYKHSITWIDHLYIDLTGKRSYPILYPLLFFPILGTYPWYDDSLSSLRIIPFTNLSPFPPPPPPPLYIVGLSLCLSLSFWNLSYPYAILSPIPYPLSPIPYPLSFIPYPLSPIPYPLSPIPYPLSPIPYPLSPIP